MYAQIDEFPAQVLPGIVATQRINLFAHTNIHARKNDHLGINFGSSYYESINSPFMLWKFYLDVLCRIVFNVFFSLFVPGVDLDCRKYTVCSSKNCSNLKIRRVREVFCRELVVFCKTLSKVSCSTFDAYFIIDVFKGYKRGEDYFSPYLVIERNE